MQKHEKYNINICDDYSIITPEQLKSQLPLKSVEHQMIIDFRKAIINIINKRDPRLLIICGPCSINDVDASFDYANRLKKLSIDLQDQLYIVMRVYLEKPRTTIGWKGLINDPDMDGLCNIECGLKKARYLLLELTKMQLPIATEILNPYIPQYIGEFFSWSAIGARTTESQIHREIASGLSMPIGFKNSTNGDFYNAINAINSAMIPHKYISINHLGRVCIMHTTGNPNGHVILRGGVMPNYYPQDIMSCEKKILESNLPSALIIDCSHGNSNKDYRRQIHVAQSIIHQIKCGNRSIIGLMIESYIHAGNQNINIPCFDKIKYGISVTDACINWEMTEDILRCLHKELKPFLINRLSNRI